MPIRAWSTTSSPGPAPWAVRGQPAKQFFFSDSVDTRSFVYQPVYEAPPYNLLALK